MLIHLRNGSSLVQSLYPATGAQDAINILIINAADLLSRVDIWDGFSRFVYDEPGRFRLLLFQNMPH